MLIRRLAALIAAASMVLMISAPVYANDLHQTPPITADDPAFQGDDTDCGGLTLAPGEVLWHFVHTGTDGTDLPSTLTATFQDAGTITVNGYSNGNGSAEVMYDITTTTGTDTLLSASDTIVDGNLLNLSHICQGGPPPDVPEAPMSILLLITGGLAGLAFVGWRMRRSSALV
jgi:ABC-type glycerol-3-phosphate transport system substrate-binding protein